MHRSCVGVLAFGQSRYIQQPDHPLIISFVTFLKVLSRATIASTTSQGGRSTRELQGSMVRLAPSSSFKSHNPDIGPKPLPHRTLELRLG